MQPGFSLLNLGRETYLLDADGRVVHEWSSSRAVFASYLLPTGNLLRDGNENQIAVSFRAGGAAGFSQRAQPAGINRISRPVGLFQRSSSIQG